MNVVSHFDETAGERRDHKHAALWMRLSMLSIRPAQDVSCILNQSMLESAASAKERNLVFPSESDGSYRQLSISIGASRYAPDAFELVKLLRAYRIGCQPNRFDLQILTCSTQTERRRNRSVSRN